MVIHNVETHISPTKYGKCGKYGEPTQILILHSTLSHSPTNLYNLNPLLYQIVSLNLICFFSNMSSKATVRRHILERQACPKEKDRTSQNILSKHLKKIYPIGLQRTTSSLSLSSLSLSLSQNSNDSSLTDSSIQLDQKISYAIRLITPPPERREVPLPKSIQQQSQELSDGELRRCNWITHTSGKIMLTVEMLPSK